MPRRRLVTFGTGGLTALAAALVLVAGTALAYTPGDDGHPTDGTLSNIGSTGSVTLTFQTNATLYCSQDTATSFHFTLNYSSANVAAGSKLVIYLSPNQGAINGNDGGNASAYIAQVESNYGVYTFPSTLVNGSGTISISVPVTHAFALASGGVLGVVADAVDGQSWTTKTNSLNCTEAPSSSPSVSQSPSASPSESPSESASASPSESPSESASASESSTPSESFAGETSTPFESFDPETSTPFESFQGETAPPTGTGDSGGGGSTPVIALMIAGLFGLLGVTAAHMQRSATRR
jgi:hypothetical protein